MNKDKAIGMFMGLFVGDALGAPVEFMRPHEFEKVTDMIGGGVHSAEIGEWTDDGAMACCIADAYIVRVSLLLMKLLSTSRHGLRQDTSAHGVIALTLDALALKPSRT